ncbi:MAG TPA: DJ-1 family glyoxalase III [Bacteroidales bacterium]|nr:DJ-1 family glyoxalase III [Bacteroidales bacterium]
MKKVMIHFAEGFEEVEAITPVDVLRRAGCEVVMVSVTGKKEVTSKRGVVVIADKNFDEINYDEADMIVLPGGQPGANNLNKHEGLKKQIVNFNAQGKFVAAICAAPLVFGSAGILKGKKATCFPGTEPQLTGANCTGTLVEIDGNIITGKGPGVAMAFSLALVEKLQGKPVADEVKETMIA